MKWDWTKVLLICGLVGTCAIAYYHVQGIKREVVCPLGQDKLVTVIVEKNKVTCVYTKEPLGLRRKYTREMWNE
jgi:hypothetical protein